MRTIKVTLQKVRLNKQGYDSRGKYFGIDKPLYLYAYWDNAHEDTIEGTNWIRANNREHAKTLIELHLKKI